MRTLLREPVVAQVAFALRAAPDPPTQSASHEHECSPTRNPHRPLPRDEPSRHEWVRDNAAQSCCKEYQTKAPPSDARAHPTNGALGTGHCLCLSSRNSSRAPSTCSTFPGVEPARRCVRGLDGIPGIKVCPADPSRRAQNENSSGIRASCGDHVQPSWPMPEMANDHQTHASEQVPANRYFQGWSRFRFSALSGSARRRR
jgi:hypothetical protein